MNTNMTKTAYMAAFRAALVQANHPWFDMPPTQYEGQPPSPYATRGERFIAHMEETITTKHNLNMLEGSAIVAWHAIGGKGKPTYKALRALPN